MGPGSKRSQADCSSWNPHNRPFKSQVDWSQPPRPPSEFVAKFSAPGSQKKLETRLKCNTYYYRANYLLILVAALVVAFVRRPSAFVALASALLGTLCMNNTFAVSLRCSHLGPKSQHKDAGLMSLVLVVRRA